MGRVRAVREDDDSATLTLAVRAGSPTVKAEEKATMKPDERELFLRVAALPPFPRGPADGSARSEADAMGMHWKRADYIFEKWAARGWYDYGVSASLGWLTEEGKAKAETLRAPAAAP
ncbi:MAG: hypothetical protein ACHREM_04755 [Polyangiales bacterium]